MSQEKLIIVMVGLPARGKSYITRKIANYLQWLSINNRVFNVGNKRRRNLEDEQNADFFDPNDKNNVRIRDQLAMDTLNEVLEYLASDGQVGIFDATNSTFKRRSMVTQYIYAHAAEKGLEDYNVLFLESICNDRAIIEQNIRLKMKGPDYRDNADKEAALEDFKKRLVNYESVYETVNSAEFGDDSRCQFLKVIDIYHLSVHNIQGFLPIMLQNFLQHFNIQNKEIWISHPNIHQSEVDPISHKPMYTLNSSVKAHKRIPTNLSLDEIHDLILDLEASQQDVLIQTNNDFLLKGLFKYFSLDDCQLDLSTHVLCILPHHYHVGLKKYDVHEIPEMTRSSSNISNASTLLTPREDWTQFNYQNLNMTELSSKLEQLKD